MPRIVLVIVADDALREMLALALRSDAYCVQLASSEDTARERLAVDLPDLLVLDSRMPLREPAERWAGRQAPGVPLVLLVPGWDDPPPLRSPTTVALSMPFGLASLRGAVAGVVRDEANASRAQVVVDDLVLAASGSVWRAGAPVDLSPAERRLLGALVAHPDTPVPTQTLVRAAWGTVSPAGDAYLAVYISRLRQTLEADSAVPRYIHAVRGGFTLATTATTRRAWMPRGARRRLPGPRPLTVFTINLDPLTAAAIRAELPQARIRAIAPYDAVRTGMRRRAPDLVILNASATDATTQRRLIQQTWVSAVVVEVSSAESRALVWRPPTDVEVVELRPGFLTSFLPTRPAIDASHARTLSALRFIGYAAVLWDLMAGLLNDQSASLMIGVGVFSVLLASLFREARQELHGV